MTANTVLEQLKATRALLTSPETWIQGNIATDAMSNSVYPGDPTAVCFCLSGALGKVTNVIPNTPFLTVPEVFGVVAGALYRDEGDWANAIVWWNDKVGRTHEQVLTLLDILITKMAGKEDNQVSTTPEALPMVRAPATVGPSLWVAEGPFRWQKRNPTPEV